MKKKFHQLVKKHTPIKINERISKFQELIAGDECVTGSGRCGTHNTKLAPRLASQVATALSKLQLSTHLRRGPIRSSGLIVRNVMTNDMCRQ